MWCGTQQTAVAIGRHKARARSTSSILWFCLSLLCLHLFRVRCFPPARAQNVLHGDLNGNNILLAGAHVSPGADDQRGFTAKVADFGLSRLLSPGALLLSVFGRVG